MGLKLRPKEEMADKIILHVSRSLHYKYEIRLNIIRIKILDV